MTTVRHYAKSSMGDALCGMDYPRTHGIAALKTDTPCPRCLALLAGAQSAPSIRSGVEHAETDLRSIVTNLSMWEGRGDWATFSEQDRQQSAARAQDLLGDVIEALTDWRGVLVAALGGNDDQADAEDNTTAEAYRTGKDF